MPPSTSPQPGHGISSADSDADRRGLRRSIVLPRRDSQGFCCSCTYSEAVAATFGTSENTDQTRANLDCNIFTEYSLFNGIAGSASCLRFDPLWYQVPHDASSRSVVSAQNWLLVSCGPKADRDPVLTARDCSRRPSLALQRNLRSRRCRVRSALHRGGPPDLLAVADATLLRSRATSYSSRFWTSPSWPT